ncbi:MAG TPA: DUF1318 domain-containing protein [Candidatus Brocadiia bacterium]|nr:DUF1318 domain-containing protein [Candidatus Brocadiia bacterium]
MPDPKRKMLRFLRAGALCAACIAQTGCLKGLSPNIRTVTKQEALRNQVLGSFEQLSSEEYEVASVRAVDAASGAVTPPPAVTPSKKEALAAQQSRMFNRDDIESFKEIGCVREKADGELEFKKTTETDSSPDLERRARAIVDEENADRAVIMRRLVDTTPGLDGEDGMKVVREIFASRQRELAKAGEWIQEPDGQWVQKK